MSFRSAHGSNLFWMLSGENEKSLIGKLVVFLWFWLKWQHDLQQEQKNGQRNCCGLLKRCWNKLIAFTKGCHTGLWWLKVIFCLQSSQPQEKTEPLLTPACRTVLSAAQEIWLPEFSYPCFLFSAFSQSVLLFLPVKFQQTHSLIFKISHLKK